MLTKHPPNVIITCALGAWAWDKNDLKVLGYDDDRGLSTGQGGYGTCPTTRSQKTLLVPNNPSLS